MNSSRDSVFCVFDMFVHSSLSVCTVIASHSRRIARQIIFCDPLQLAAALFDGSVTPSGNSLKNFRSEYHPM